LRRQFARRESFQRDSRPPCNASVFEGRGSQQNQRQGLRSDPPSRPNQIKRDRQVLELGKGRFGLFCFCCFLFLRVSTASKLNPKVALQHQKFDRQRGQPSFRPPLVPPRQKPSFFSFVAAPFKKSASLIDWVMWTKSKGKVTEIRGIRHPGNRLNSPGRNEKTNFGSPCGKVPNMPPNSPNLRVNGPTALSLPDRGGRSFRWPPGAFAATSYLVSPQPFPRPGAPGGKVTQSQVRVASSVYTRGLKFIT